MTIAVHFEGAVLGCFQHVLHGDFVGCARQLVAAAGAAQRRHDARAPQAQQDLFDVVAGKPLSFGELAGGDRTFAEPAGELNADDETVFCPGSDAHGGEASAVACRRQMGNGQWAMDNGEW